MLFSTHIFLTAVCLGLAVWVFYLLWRLQNLKSLSIPSFERRSNHELYRELEHHQNTAQLLRETQEYMSCVINSMPAILIGINPSGIITHWNDSAAKTSGLSADEALGSYIRESFPDLPFDMSNVHQTIASGIPYSRKNIRDGSGSQARFTNITIYPLVSDDISGAVILAEDVTPRVRMENLLIQNEKMTSLGELAAGVAHEINNPLAGILNNAQNILRRTSPDLEANAQIAEKLGTSLETIIGYLNERDIPQFLDNIRTSGERAAAIVKNLLDFSRGERQQQLTDINQLIDHTLDLARKNFELDTLQGIELPKVVKYVDTELKPLICSPSELQQVLINLLRNAAQAMTTEEYGPPPDPQIVIVLKQEAQELVIEVADNGPGMSEEVLKHIFEPFYTTKDIGRGTGLGLSVSYFIIKEHHQGTIEAESSPGEGTRFTIRLPCSQTTQNRNIRQMETS